MSHGPVVQYRMPGCLSGRSLLFVKQLKEDGEEQAVIDCFENHLANFESLSLMRPYEEAVKAFPLAIPERYEAYLRELVKHIRALAEAERYEELHWIALNGDFADSIKAMKMLGDFDGVG